MKTEDQALLIDSAINSYKKTYQGYISNDVLDKNLRSLQSLKSEVDSGYSVKINAQGFLFYTSVTMQQEDSGSPLAKVFIGNAGGLGACGGVVHGYLYLCDGLTLEALYQKTTSFQINIAPLVTNINIFDGYSNPIAHVVGVGVQGGLFIGGGTAYWE